MGKFNNNTLKSTVQTAERPSLIADGDGLYIKLGKTGESWIFRYQVMGRRRDLGLGKYPDVGLKDARDAALRARALTRSGIDPIDHKHAAAKEATEKNRSVSDTNTFRCQAEIYIDSHSAGWKSKKHKQQWENTLEQYAYPAIGDKDVADITTDDVLAILKPIWTQKNETASRVRSRIELILNAARAMQLRNGTNPALWRGHLDALLPKPSKVQKVRNHPSMPWQKLPSFWRELSSNDSTRANALRLTILTGCRTGEVLGATWSELDLNNKLWSIPASRMKAGKPHTVPLSDAAMEVITAQQGAHDTWIFPGQRGKSPLSNMAMAMLLRELTPEYTVHGFRSTFRVWGAEETNHPSAVMEIALAHAIPNATEAAYQRSDLLKKRRALMNDWAQFVTGGAA